MDSQTVCVSFFFIKDMRFSQTTNIDQREPAIET